MAHWPGRYRLVYSDELRDWYEKHIGATLRRPDEIESALREAEVEAASAELWVSPDHFVASRSNGREFYRAPLSVAGNTARFTKPPGVQVELERDDEGVVAREPGKPTMRFVQVTPLSRE